jgi:nucleoside phosphorylase/hypoxanthine phosphoribosyltransferase
MISHQEIFLNPFSEEVLRFAVIEYGKRINQYSNEFDVIIIMARKAVCFAESLRMLKLTSYQCVATSNRVLDMDIQWLRGKKVAILDDALITGTTIYRTKKKLESIGCQVSVYVLCVNLDSWSKDLVEPELPYLKLHDAKTASFCSSIVDAISLIPLPYSTDYPIYSNIRIRKNDFESLFSSGDWLINDVSSSLQAKYEVFAKVFEPTQNLRKRFFKSLGADFSDILIKVRLFGRWFNKTKDTYLCNLLPIFALDPLPKETIDNLYYSLKQESAVTPDIWGKWFECISYKQPDIENDRYKAKLRLINYVAASRLARLWFSTMEINLSNRIIFEQDIQSVGFLFPYPILEHIKKVEKLNGPVFQNANFQSSKVNVAILSNNGIPKLKYDGDDGWSIESHLTSPFLQLYKQYEIPARKLALEHGREIFENSEIHNRYSHLITRLDRGFSSYEIRQWLDHLKDRNLPLVKTTSCFLDRFIDRGIIVPTTCVIDDYVFRAYRHGEDVLFGENEKKLVAYMLKSFTEGADNRLLSGKEIEKSTVLLIKKGLSAGFLERPNKNVLGLPGTIGVRFSLHGAIVEEDSTKIYSTGSGCSIRKILVDSEYLEVKTKKRSDGEEYTSYRVKFTGKDISGIKAGGIEEAKLLGRLLGSLRRAARKKSQKRARLLDNDLVLIATVSSEKDLAAALAAEIRLAKSAFRHYRTRYESFEFVKSTREEAGIKFKEMRNVGKDELFASLSSGTWKYSEYKNGKVWKIIRKIEEKLAEEKRWYEYDLWIKYWKETHDQNGSEVPLVLSNLLNREAEWLYYMRTFHSILELAFLIHHYSENSELDLYKRTIENRLEIEGFAKYCREFGSKTEFREKLLSTKLKEGNIRLDDLRSFAINSMEKKLLEAEDILAVVDAIVTPYGKIERLMEYRNALIVYYKCRDTRYDKLYGKIDDIISSSKAAFKKAHYGKHSSIRIVPSEYHGIANAIMVVGYSFPELDCLIKCITRISSNLAEYSDIRSILIFDLPDNARLMCKEGTNEYFGSIFLKDFKAIHDNFADRKYTNELIAVSHSGKLREKNLWPYTNRELDRIFNNKTELHDITVKDNFDFKFKAEVFSTRSNFGEVIIKREVDVGIIGIVSDEMRAIISHLRDKPGYRDDIKGKKWNRDFILGNLPAKGNGSHSVACIQAIKQGNQAVIPAYQALQDEFNPILIVLMGIGGVVHEDLQLCDVCISNGILNYDSRAVTTEGTKHTFDPLPPIEPWLRQIYLRLEKKFGERMEIPAWPKSKNPNFRIIMAPIGSGGAVVKDEEAEIRDWLSIVSRNIGVVDTEAVGAAEQYDASKLRRDSRAKGFLVIRGISDFADKNKNKTYRYEPVRNAMIFLEEFLKESQEGFIGET